MSHSETHGLGITIKTIDQSLGAKRLCKHHTSQDSIEDNIASAGMKDNNTLTNARFYFANSPALELKTIIVATLGIESMFPPSPRKHTCNASAVDRLTFILCDTTVTQLFYASVTVESQFLTRSYIRAYI